MNETPIASRPKRNRSSSSGISYLSPHLSQLEKKQRTEELFNSTLEESLDQVTDNLNSKMADPILVASLIEALICPEVKESIVHIVIDKLQEKNITLQETIEAKDEKIKSLET